MYTRHNKIVFNLLACFPVKALTFNTGRRMHKPWNLGFAGKIVAGLQPFLKLCVFM